MCTETIYKILFAVVPKISKDCGHSKPCPCWTSSPAPPSQKSPHAVPKPWKISVSHEKDSPASVLVMGPPHPVPQRHPPPIPNGQIASLSHENPRALVSTAPKTTSSRPTMPWTVITSATRKRKQQYRWLRLSGRIEEGTLCHPVHRLRIGRVVSTGARSSIDRRPMSRWSVDVMGWRVTGKGMRGGG